MKPTSHSNKMHSTQHEDLELWVSVASLSGSGGDREGERESHRDRDRVTHQGLVCRLSLAVGAG